MTNNNTTKATGSFSIHCAQSSDDELDFLYYSNRSNFKDRRNNNHESGKSFRNHDILRSKKMSVSPFEPLTKDRNYDSIHGCGKISPLPQNEYEIWARRKRDAPHFHHSFHHSHFRPVVISHTHSAVGGGGGDAYPVVMESAANSVSNNSSSDTSMNDFFTGECNTNTESMSLQSIEELKLENEYLQKKVERLERLLQQQQQQQQVQQPPNQRQTVEQDVHQHTVTSNPPNDPVPVHKSDETEENLEGISARNSCHDANACSPLESVGDGGKRIKLDSTETNNST